MQRRGVFGLGMAGLLYACCCAPPTDAQTQDRPASRPVEAANQKVALKVEGMT